MNSRLAGVLLLLTLYTLTEGMSLRGVGLEPRCRCSGTEGGRVAKLIKSVEILPPNPHCRDTEVIATLQTGKKICLDTKADWVKKLIEKMLAKSRQ